MCTNFNSGETWAEEHTVKEITEDRIVTVHIADYRKEDGKLVRRECREQKEKVGKTQDIEYFSRPLKEIIRKHKEENEWLCDQLLKMDGDGD